MNKNLQKLGIYRLKEVIGRGGMGMVYRGYHPHLQRSVAVKVISPKGPVTREDRKRFFNEARLTSRLKHPNIITIYDVGTESGIDYIVMDFVKGFPLSHLLKKRLFPIRKSLEIIKQVALAVDLAHQNGIVHRDLKPSNLMIEATGRVVVMDFGLAKNINAGENLTQSGGILGTPHYMAPEQAQSRLKDISACTDVYALGAILYEMLAGARAIAGEDVMNIIFNVIYKDPLPLCSHNKKIAKDLETICHKAMEKSPSLRYQNAKAFAKDIERFLAGESILANPDPWQRKWAKRFTKNKWATTTFLIFIGAFIIVLIAFYWHNWQQQKQQVALYLDEVDEKLETNFIRKTKKALKQGKLSEHKIIKALEIYVACGEILEKARNLLPQDRFLRKKLYGVQKNVGLLALAKENFLLAEVAFRHCLKLEKSSRAKKLQAFLKQERNKKQKRQEKRLENIMGRLEEKLPLPALVDWYVVQILRMPGKHTLKKLIFFLEQGNLSQRLISAETLGKFTDPHTKIQDKDAVEWLIKRLQNVPATQEKELKTLIWALGWLRDSRANAVVSKIRMEKGTNGSFWKSTIIPYSWIPISKQTKADAQSIGIMKSMKGDTREAISDFSAMIAKNPKKIELYMNRARSLLKSGNAKKALADYATVIEINPEYSKVYINRGVLYMKKGAYKQALADFSKAVEISPQAMHLNYRGEAHYQLWALEKALADYNKAISIKPLAIIYANRAMTYAYQSKIIQAREDLKKALTLATDKAAIYQRRAIARQTWGNIRGAIEDYTWVIEKNPQDIAVYIKRAILYLRIGKYDNAISDCTEVIRKNPRYTDAYINRGMAYLKKNSPQQAFADYNRALRINPKSVSAYCYRARAYFLQGKKELCQQDFQKAAALDPNLLTIYVERGAIRVETGDYQGAVEDCRKALSLNPKRASVYMTYGSALRLQGKLQQALEKYQQAIKINPKLPQVYTNIGRVLAGLNRPQEAIKQYGKQIDLHPRIAFGAYNNRANLRASQGDVQGALIDINTSIRIRPRMAASHANKSSILFRLGAYKKSIESANMALKLNPNLVEAYAARARAWSQLGALDQAIADHTKCISLNPGFFQALFGRAIVYTKKREFYRAISDYTKAIKLKPDSYFCYANRGSAYKDLGFFRKALKDLNKAIKLNPKGAQAYTLRAASYQGLRRVKLAIKDCNYAIKLNSKAWGAYQQRASAWISLKQRRRAIKDLNKAIELNPKAAGSLMNRGAIYAQLGNIRKALEDTKQAAKANPNIAAIYYNLACYYCRSKKPRKALENLEKAFKKGFKNFAHMAQDKDLRFIRNSRKYRLLVARYKRQ